MFQYQLSEPQSMLRYLNVAYKDEPVLKFNVAQYFKTRTEQDAIFVHINGYLNQLPPDVQDKFYEILLEFKNQIKHFGDRNYVSQMQAIIAKVTNLLGYQNFVDWYAANSNCLIPDTVKPTYTIDQDLNTTREKTYILDEYVRLLGLVEFVRLLTPFLAEYLAYYKQAGTNYYYRIFMLFIKSDIYESEEVDKLRDYLGANQASNATSDSELIFDMGLSTDDFLDDIISEIIIGKLMSIDFIGKEKFNAITYVFRTLRNKGQRYGANSIRSTSARRNSRDEDYSYFEEQRKTSDITHQNIVELQYALSDHSGIIASIGMDRINESFYRRELKLAMEFANRGDLTLYITKQHMILLGWCLTKYINPRALYYVGHTTIIELLVLFKVIAVTKGYPYIGLFLNAYIDIESDYVLPSTNASIDRESSIELAKHYTYISEGDRSSIIDKTITELSKKINGDLYIPLNTDDRLSQYINEEGILMPVGDLNQRLMMFVKEFIV